MTGSTITSEEAWKIIQPMRLASASNEQIVKAMTKAGLRTTTGKRFDSATVSGIVGYFGGREYKRSGRNGKSIAEVRYQTEQQQSQTARTDEQPAQPTKLEQRGPFVAIAEVAISNLPDTTKKTIITQLAAGL